MLKAIYEWLLSLFRATAPQRADFESVNTSWRDYAAALSLQMTTMRKEFLEAREHDRKRIDELEKEAEECRAFRAADLAETEKLRGEVVRLRRELASLRAETEKAPDTGERRV
jgi:predicted nuclease with TOPRIM domain